jgi:uncharacterized protein (TIGR02284 family)
MSDYRKDGDTSTSSSAGSQSEPQGLSTPASAVADRAKEVAKEVWQTTRAAGRQAAERGGELVEEGYDGARRAVHRASDNPLATFLIGAAVGYAVAYAVYASAEPRRGRNDEVIDTLNGLIAISFDGEQGFRTAAEAVRGADIRRIFNHAADRCAEGAAELQRKVRALGGDPQQGGSVAGSLHRRWTDLKSAITGMDDLSILNEVERGEDVAKAAYTKALKMDLPADVRSIVERQYQGVRQNHDRVRDLRNAAG